MRTLDCCCKCGMPLSVPEMPVLKSMCINPQCGEFLVTGVNSHQHADRTGVLVKFYRTERKMSLRSLAEKIGKTPGWLSKVERGTTRPGMETAINLALALGKDPEWLLWQMGETAPWMARLLREGVVAS